VQRLQGGQRVDDRDRLLGVLAGQCRVREFDDQQRPALFEGDHAGVMLQLDEIV